MRDDEEFGEDNLFFPQGSLPALPTNRIARFLELPDTRPMLAQRLEQYAREHRLTWKQLAAYLGVTSATLRNWRKGKLPWPKVQARVLALLEVTPEKDRLATPEASEAKQATPPSLTAGPPLIAELLAEWLKRLPPGQALTLEELEACAARLRAALER